MTFGMTTRMTNAKRRKPVISGPARGSPSSDADIFQAARKIDDAGKR
jgi:hypothetical protein